MQKQLNNQSIYFGCTYTDLVSLSLAPLSAMTAGSSCLKRLVSSSACSWSTNVVAGRPFERLPCFGSQRSSWKTISFLLLQQWPLNCRQHIWRLVEIGGSSPMYTMFINGQLAIFGLFKFLKKFMSPHHQALQNMLSWEASAFLV